MENSTTRELVGDAFVDPVTDEVRHIIQISNYVVICGSVSLFGIVANIINISVFVRQGFKDTINISLLGLAVSDLVCSITMFWVSITYNLLLHNLDLPFVILDISYITGGWIHVCFNRVTSFITAFITLERCLCIAMPLKVKNIITPFRTKVIITSIFVLTISLFVPFYFVNKLEWKLNPSRNKTILSITFTEDREIVESVTFFIHSVFLSSVLLLTVVVCTLILVVKLNQKTKWRKTASKQETTSAKEKKVVKMITLIASIFLVCYIPPTIIFLVMVFFPELSVGSRLENLLHSIWSVLFVLDAVNSSVNICVYFKMSTKYRLTLLQLISVLPRDDSPFTGDKNIL